MHYNYRRYFLVPINIFSENSLSWMPQKNTLKRPIYQSLVHDLEEKIKSNILMPGTRLPSQRELADYLDLNFTTITRAYKLSEQKNLTYGIVGKGTYISPTVNTSPTITPFNTDKTINFCLISAFEENNNLLTNVIADISSQSNINHLLTYDSPIGMTSQRKVAINYLKKIGFSVSLDNIAITSGGQNALTIILLALFNANDKIAVDRFTYVNFIEIAKLAQIKLIPIDYDSAGMIPEKLKYACEHNHINGIYLMPYFANPTGISITDERKIALAQVIKSHELVLIEDNYLHFLNIFDIGSSIQMRTLLPDQTITIISMTKAISTGLRVGYLLFPSKYKHSLVMSLINVNVKTSSLDAEIITQSLVTGVAYDIMYKKIVLAQHANDTFNTVFKDYPNLKTNTLFFKWIPLKKSTLSGKKIESFFLHQGIRLFHSDRFLVSENDKQTFLRISLSAINNAETLKSALIKLKTLLEQFDYI